MSEKQCKHGSCTCLTSRDEQFCCKLCKNTETSSTLTSCGCGHTTCNTTMRQSNAGSLDQTALHGEKDQVLLR